MRPHFGYGYMDIVMSWYNVTWWSTCSTCTID